MNGIDIRLGYTNLRGILDGKRTIRYKSISDILISMFSGVNKCSQGHNIFVIDFGSSRYQIFVISLIRISAEFPAHNVRLHTMAAAFVHYQTPCTQLGWVFLCFPFCYNSNISLIYHGCPVDSGCPTPHDGCSVFSLSDNLHPIQLSVSMFFLFIMFHLSFFQIYFHSYLAYLISDISRGTCI